MTVGVVAVFKVLQGILGQSRFGTIASWTSGALLGLLQQRHSEGFVCVLVLLSYLLSY